MPLAKASQEMKSYLNLDMATIESDPIEWWGINCKHFPLLSELAQQFLCVTGNSIPCEQLFSKMGQIISDRRTNLNGNKAEMIGFICCNFSY